MFELSSRLYILNLNKSTEFPQARDFVSLISLLFVVNLLGLKLTLLRDFFYFTAITSSATRTWTYIIIFFIYTLCIDKTKTCTRPLRIDSLLCCWLLVVCRCWYFSFVLLLLWLLRDVYIYLLPHLGTRTRGAGGGRDLRENHQRAAVSPWGTAISRLILLWVRAIAVQMQNVCVCECARRFIHHPESTLWLLFLRIYYGMRARAIRSHITHTYNYSYTWDDQHRRPRITRNSLTWPTSQAVCSYHMYMYMYTHIYCIYSIGGAVGSSARKSFADLATLVCAPAGVRCDDAMHRARAHNIRARIIATLSRKYINIVHIFVVVIWLH